MNDKEKQLSFFKKPHFKGKSNFLNSPLRKWWWKNGRTIGSNVRYRLIFLVLDLLLLIGGLYLLVNTLQNAANWVSQLLAVGFFVALLYVPFMYFARSLLQINSELALNGSVYAVRSFVRRLQERSDERNIRSLKAAMNDVRIYLKDFVSVSNVLSPPIYNYELERTQKNIDIFFNSIGEMLFPFKGTYSKAQKIDEQLTLDYYNSLEHPTDEEYTWQFEEAQKRDRGEIDSFDYGALDEFMEYLGDTVFAKTAPYLPFSYRHSIDLIDISRFFETWNSVASHCSKGTFEKVRDDIEEYYKSEWQNKQKRRELEFQVLIVIIPVVLSTILLVIIARVLGA